MQYTYKAKQDQKHRKRGLIKMRVLKKRKWLLGVAVLLTFASVTWVALSTSVNSLTREENERMNELYKQGYSMEEIDRIITEEFYSGAKNNSSSLPEGDQSTISTDPVITPTHTHMDHYSNQESYLYRTGRTDLHLFRVRRN